MGLLQPKIIRDLNLYEYGLRVVERRVQNLLPLPDGRHLLTREDRTEQEIAKFSAKDAARYPAYQAQIRRVAEVLRTRLLVAPPNLVTGDLSVAVRELSKFATVGKRLWQARSLRAAFQLLRKSAGEMLDTWFESDPIKAVLGFDAVVVTSRVLIRPVLRMCCCITRSLNSTVSRASGAAPSVAWVRSHRP